MCTQANLFHYMLVVSAFLKTMPEFPVPSPFSSDAAASSREEALQSNYSFQMGMNTERRGSKSDLPSSTLEHGVSLVKQRQDTQW